MKVGDGVQRQRERWFGGDKELCYACGPPPQDECKHHVLQICTNETKIIIKSSYL